MVIVCFAVSYTYTSLLRRVFSNVRQIIDQLGHCLLCSLLYISPWLASRHGFAIWIFIQNETVLLIWISFLTYQFYVPPTFEHFSLNINVMKTNETMRTKFWEHYSFSWWAQLKIFVSFWQNKNNTYFNIPYSKQF